MNLVKKVLIEKIAEDSSKDPLIPGWVGKAMSAGATVGGLGGALVGTGVGALGAYNRGGPILNGALGGMYEGAKHGVLSGAALASAPLSYKYFGEWGDVPAALGVLGSGAAAVRGLGKAYEAGNYANDPMYNAARRINQASGFYLGPQQSARVY